MRFTMIIINALACYFLCDLDQQKKFKIAARRTLKTNSNKKKWPINDDI